MSEGQGQLSKNNRVVLLLDLDCFYAQCERVRLGLPPDTSLALLQWNSVLAVSYPARDYGIKRGDSWEEVRQKSNGKCLALHLPILSAKASVAQSDRTNNAEASIERSYQQEYSLTTEEQRQYLDTAAGVQRYPQEGKACLERYRIASSRIFSVVLESLTNHVGKNRFILERASIDELFLDVTDHCWGHVQSAENTNSLEESTVVVGDIEKRMSRDYGENEDDRLFQSALVQGCTVAKHVRDDVYRELGFTLSAGISTCKLVAKLGATYGKPNGQAVIFPRAIDHVMKETRIRKVRHLGGKIGKKVQALLPPGEENMLSVAKMLSLPILCKDLGEETGRMVFDACRGIDHEPVKETEGALTKSITAFKSFPSTQVLSVAIGKWILLLISDVMSRVEKDRQRNNRFPKTLTIQYTASRHEHEDRTARSVRMPFPKKEISDDQQKEFLVEQVRGAIQGKEGSPCIMHRIGLCATDFEARPHEGGISSYFCKGSSISSLTTIAKQCSGAPDSNSKGCVSEDAKASPETTNAEVTIVTTHALPADEDFARQLQKQYDRENQVLTSVEMRSNTNSRNRDASWTSPKEKHKKSRIDSFFGKSK